MQNLNSVPKIKIEFLLRKKMKQKLIRKELLIMDANEKIIKIFQKKKNWNPNLCNIRKRFNRVLTFENRIYARYLNNLALKRATTYYCELHSFIFKKKMLYGLRLCGKVLSCSFFTTYSCNVCRIDLHFTNILS